MGNELQNALLLAEQLEQLEKISKELKKMNENIKNFHEDCKMINNGYNTIY